MTSGIQLLAQKSDEGIITWQIDGNGSTIGFTYGNQVYFYLKNAQGDIIGIADSTGTEVATYVYDSWGKLLNSVNGIGEINPLRYRGYYFDLETGLYYLNARYYDPETGRFISADDTEILLESPDELNLYAYCINNPIRYSDPSGNIVLVDDAAVVVILASGAVISTTWAWVNSPAGQQAIQEGATALQNGIEVAGKAIGDAVDWIGEKLTDAWNWATGNDKNNQSVEEILKNKKGSIKNAPLPPSSPDWSSILKLTLGEVARRAKKDLPGYKTILKLLKDSRFNK